jgi:CDP-glucose 4,6-dehydratase
MAERDATGHQLSKLHGAFNFGPALGSNRPVADLVTEILGHWPGSWEARHEAGAPHEAALLNLATDKAYHLLGWQPVWDFPTTIRHTVEWYRTYFANAAQMADVTRRQLQTYTRDAQLRMNRQNSLLAERLA